MPTLYELGVLAQNTNQKCEEQDQITPLGWRVWLVSSRDLSFSVRLDGYLGKCFINDQKEELVIGHRGTKLEGFPGNLFSDSQILFNQIPNEAETAYKFTSLIYQFLATYRPKYRIWHTGHSLGGVHAHLCGYRDKVEVVAFDNPGCANILALASNGKLDSQQLDHNHFSFLSLTNPINTTNEHLGQVFQLEEDVQSTLTDKAHSSSNLTQPFKTHYLDYLLAHMPNSQDVTQREAIPPKNFRQLTSQDQYAKISFSSSKTHPWVANIEEIRQGYPKVQIKNTVVRLGTLTSYRMESQLINKPEDQPYYISQNHWLIAHVVSGDIKKGGHSSLVVEGLNVEHTSGYNDHYYQSGQKPKVAPFYAIYELIVPANAKQDENGIKYAEIRCRLLSHLPYANAIKSDPKRAIVWPCPKQQAQSMIEDIEKNEVKKSIPYDIFGLKIDQEENIFHNCTSWVLAMIKKHTDIQDPGSNFNMIFYKPYKNTKFGHQQSISGLNCSLS